MVGEPLPRAAEAVVPEQKLVDYALNPEHLKGRHKARVFASSLGIHRGDAAYLEDAIREAILTAPVSAVRTATPHGYLYTVPILLDGLNGATHQVITAWFFDPAGTTPPRLTTVYVDIP